ncbi:MAG: hypothetical protein QOI76_3427 [Frankiales bacterium]|jgi:hypothetical protein|nr:hypothetical protein [Frankiales bacterium]
MARAGDGNSGRRRRGRSAAAGRPAEDEPAGGRHQTAQSWPDGDFAVRQVSGTPKVFRCPGCDQEIRPGSPHVVAWPEGRLDDRRHWHTACWSNRLHRAPVVQRSRNAPRL